MGREDEYPSQHPMGTFRDESLGQSKTLPRGATHEPWIDIHGHHHTLTWRDHQEFSLSGCVAVVMAGGLGYETPYRPVRAADVRAGWDRVIRLSHSMNRSHFFDIYTAVGIHTSPGPIDDVEDLLDVLPEYAALEEVVAISETGISMVQEHESLPLTDQKRLIAEQMEIAAETDLPMVLHTPSVTKGSKDSQAKTTEAHDHGELVLDRENAKREAVEICLDLKDDVGIADEQIVFTHAHPSMAAPVLEESDCYVSFTVGDDTRPMTTADVAETIREYGSDRIMIDSDCAGNKEQTPVAVKTGMLELYRHGIDAEDVGAVALRNQVDVLDLDIETDIAG